MDYKEWSGSSSLNIGANLDLSHFSLVPYDVSVFTSFHLSRSAAAFCSRKHSSMNLSNTCSCKLVFLKKASCPRTWTWRSSKKKKKEKNWNVKWIKKRQFCHFPEQLLGTAVSPAMPNSSVCRAGNLETLPLENTYFTHSSIHQIISSRFPEASWGGRVCVRGSLYCVFSCICRYIGYVTLLFLLTSHSLEGISQSYSLRYTFDKVRNYKIIWGKKTLRKSFYRMILKMCFWRV